MSLIGLVVVTSLRKREFTNYAAVRYCHFTKLVDPALSAENIMNTGGDFVPSVMVAIPEIYIIVIFHFISFYLFFSV